MAKGDLNMENVCSYGTADDTPGLCIQNSSQNISANISIDFAAMLDFGFTVDINKLQVVSDCGIVTVITLLGLVINPLCVVAFSRDKTKPPTTLMLQILAIADTLFLLANFVFNSLRCFLKNDFKQHSSTVIGSYFEEVTYIFLEVMRDCTVWLVVVVTANRYMAVYSPFRAIHMNRRMVVVSTVAVSIYVVLFNLPRIFEREIQKVQGENGSTTTRRRGRLARNITYITTYYIIDSVLNVLMPMVMVTAMNMRMIKVLRVAWRSRSRMDSNRDINRRADQDRNTRTTFMLVTIALVFVACEMPQVCFFLTKVSIVSSLDTMNDMTIKQLETILVLNSVSIIFQNINSLANFFVYCLIGKLFRRILCDMFQKSFLVRQSRTRSSVV
jgi:hypothetical protein